MFNRNTWSRLLFFTAFLTFGCSTNTEASQLVFQGQNAALFPNANPADTAALMNSVHKPSQPASTLPVVSPATLIQQSVQSQISSKIYNDIFTGTSASGFYDLGGGSSIGYTRSGGYITISITNPANGTTTITVPDV